MRVLYRPFGIIAGIVGIRLGRAVFRQLWSQVDSGEPPTPRTPDTSLPKVVGAAALEAATMAAISAAVDTASRRSFQYLVGVWPGDKRKEEPAE
jgi:Protein of unknown function (DUF4235)